MSAPFSPPMHAIASHPSFRSRFKHGYGASEAGGAVYHATVCPVTAVTGWDDAGQEWTYGARRIRCVSRKE